MSTSTSSSSSAYQSPVSSSDDMVYQSVSRAAVGSLILAVLGLMSFLLVGLVILPAVGLLLGINALVSIRRYPEELLGKPFAKIGIALSLLTLVTAPAYHAYVYATEVPPGYERVAFCYVNQS